MPRLGMYRRFLTHKKDRLEAVMPKKAIQMLLTASHKYNLLLKERACLT